MNYTGVCLGAATISVVTLEDSDEGLNMIESSSYPHEGEPRRVLLNLLENKQEARICATGRKFRHVVKLPSISEPEAVELAYAYCYKDNDFDGIVSAGGETFIFYELDSKGIIGNVFTGSKCASGTGEFFLQQIKRINLTPEHAMQAAQDALPYPVAGRCSVFCKSDCTHALNKGEDKGRVVAGLCHMMAGKIFELVQQTQSRNILLVGGTAQNNVMVSHLKSFSNLNAVVPEEAPYFEALGAALWAYHHNIEPVELTEEALFKPFKGSFSFFPPLDMASEQVSFKTITRSKAEKGDRLILGLDVGSTTTKAVLIREDDHALVASTYLRTNGDPVQASRNCYIELAKQVPEKVTIFALGVTGSGREIAALHALSPGVINEIIAHATAALYFDSEVDTIFEIGGQDAKYTYIVNGVPADYAMNEACSAGTGSFLEEAAQESLEVSMTEIAPLALKATSPPDFNDQCAAFIGSDIKTAVQEGINTHDILAGLVYSICQNYLTRVKGSRPVGQKVFMQGGVCYNQAVPVAMAALLEKPIVVPPEPGLMGAFGVALDVQAKIKDGFLPENSFDLNELAAREIKYEKQFVCKGSENCDRKCPVKVLTINGKRYPFGGACSKYSNSRNETGNRKQGRDYVFEREKILFNQALSNEHAEHNRTKTVGINRSLLTHTFYPLYYHFFIALGFNVSIPNKKDPSAIINQGASFCFPVELSHSFFAELKKLEPDYFFLPQVRGLPVTDNGKVGTICPLAQAEPYYLKAAFPELYDNDKVLTPVFDFSKGFQRAVDAFIQLGRKLGATPNEAKQAYFYAVSRQEEFISTLKSKGKHVLSELEKDPDKKAIILFGRAYNAFTSVANLGISQKFASRGLDIIPCDCLPYEGEESFNNMYWASGQMNIQAARMVQRHPQLFGVFISNFSCGPDSFIVGYFREIMGNKPSLTLELDSHSSDAGLDTRIDAFLDIIEGYLKTQRYITQMPHRNVQRPKSVLHKGAVYLQLPSGEQRPLNHPTIKLLLPSMGKESTSLMASSLKFHGINAVSLPEPGEKELMLGQGQSNCKECLPLQLTVGSLLRYLDEHPGGPDDYFIYFMPDTSGPCRFGQYQVFTNQLLNRLGIQNVATLSLSSDNSYGGLGTGFTLRAWMALITADVLSDVYSSLLVLAKDRDKALSIYEDIYKQLLNSYANQNNKDIYKTIEQSADRFAQVELADSIHDVPKIALLGEIYVRSDNFSRQNLVEYFADHGIVAKVAPISEWLYYTDYLLQNNLLQNYTLKEKIKNRLQYPVKRNIEKRIKKSFAKTGLYDYHLVQVNELMDVGSNYIMPQLTGEAILTVSSAIVEIIDHVSGAVALGPFGCMPNRIAEAIAGKAFTDKRFYRPNGKGQFKAVLEHHPHLPFMAIETDGNVFPQVVEARLESFTLQVKRLHELIKHVHSKEKV